MFGACSAIVSDHNPNLIIRKNVNIDITRFIVLLYFHNLFFDNIFYTHGHVPSNHDLDTGIPN